MNSKDINEIRIAILDLASAAGKLSEIANAALQEEREAALPTSDEIEDEALLIAVGDYLAKTPRHATEVRCVTLRVGFDKIELIRAPLVSTSDIRAALVSAGDATLGERIKAAVERASAVDVDVIAAAVRTPPDLVAETLKAMGWAFDGRLWQNPDDGPTSGD